MTRRITLTDATTYGCLAAAAATALLLPSQLTIPGAWGSGPATIRLTGVVRDFHVTHPDFGVVPAGGTGHYAGSVLRSFDTVSRPELRPSGFKVATEWTERSGNPIAPHLYATNGGYELAPFTGAATAGPVLVTRGGIMRAAPGEQLTVSSNFTGGPAIIVEKDDGSMPAASAMPSVLDGDVMVGPGGDPGTDVVTDGIGMITGTAGTLPAPQPFPPIEVPDLGPSMGDFIISSDVVNSTSREFDIIEMTNSATVTIDGQVTIICDSVILRNSCQVQLLPGATLDLYVRNAVLLENSSQINTDLADPELVTIHYLHTDPVLVENAATMVANVYAPNAQLTLQNAGMMTGNFIGQSLEVGQGSVFTASGTFLGARAATDACGDAINDTAGGMGATSTGGITSAASLDQWYTDVLGVNLSGRHAITLTDNGSGVFEYLDNAFHPINGRLMGNDNGSNNSYFTYAFATSFRYSACTNQFFEFEGDDDAWMYIDGKLALDLGGVQPGTPQYVPVDRLDLVDGQTYTLRFFYAQRHGSSSTFRLRTNLPLAPNAMVGMVTEGFD